MFVTHLSLEHFRNYQRLELDLSQRLTLLQGQNGQGKTNLLEALYFLATSKPVHAQTEREVVDWQAHQEPIPYCRVAASVQLEEDGRQRTLDLEVLLTPRGDGVNYSKQIKINGVARRAMDLVGLLRAVLFLPEDVKLVDGSPGERRRYLDIALCQIDRRYCRGLSAYQKVVTQRNSLLKTLREQGAHANAPTTQAQLGYWDEKLIEYGSAVMARRHNVILDLARNAKAHHADLSDGKEDLDVQYLPSFNYSEVNDGEFERWVEALPGQDLSNLLPMEAAASMIAERYAANVAEQRSRELAAGLTLCGPHRDDMRFVVNGHDLRPYGSRGQQRTAALALKLAEVEVMTAATGAAPLLLLDDVMSELDAQRRSKLLTVLDGVAQAIVTTTDWNDFTLAFRERAQCFHVAEAAVTEANPNTTPAD